MYQRQIRGSTNHFKTHEPIVINDGQEGIRDDVWKATATEISDMLSMQRTIPMFAEEMFRKNHQPVAYIVFKSTADLDDMQITKNKHVFANMFSLQILTKDL